MIIEPPTIEHFVGQEQVVARFRVALEAAWTDGTRLPHMLMVGPPGVGKTLLAHLAAREMGVMLHERLAQVVAAPPILNGLLLQAADRDIVFLDEVHELTPDTQTALYRAMEDRQISVRHKDDRTTTLTIKDVTIIGATTDQFRLLGPLQDRFKLILPFAFYDRDALAHIVWQRAQMLHITIANDVAGPIAARSRGTPRLALRLLEACHRFARSQGADYVTREYFETTMQLEGVDALGLGVPEQQYLRLLAQRNGAPVRLTTIESVLGIHARTIQQVIEPYLIRIGLVERAAQGRVLTPAGVKHVESLRLQPATH